jgi:rhodanese-related sulfurtransferase
MKKTLFLSLAFVSLSLISCGSAATDNDATQANESVQQETVTPELEDQKQAVARMISQEEFKKMITEKEVQIIDVRTPEEYASGNIPNAVNISSNDAQLKQKLEALDKSKPYVMYCVSGARSGNVMTMMSQMGFQEVYNLEGGYPSYAAGNK